MLRIPDNIDYEIKKIKLAAESSSWVNLSLVCHALLNLLSTSHTRPEVADKAFNALELNQEGVDKVKLHITPEFINMFKDQPLIVLKALHSHSPLLEAVYGKISQQLEGKPPRQSINDFLEDFLGRKVTYDSLKKSTEEASIRLMTLVEYGENTPDNLAKLKRLHYLVEGLFDTTSYKFSVISYRIQKFLDERDSRDLE